MLVAPLATAGAGPAAGGAVVVATRTDEDERTLDRLRLVLLVSAVAAAVLAAAGALVLTRRALRPLARLSSAARDIETTGDPSRRLPHPSTRDELATLADTLNAMLAALERARERERRFVADASHELRTPLTALRGNAGYVARHGADPEALADLERDAARLARLLDDLLALAREDAGSATGGARRPRGPGPRRGRGARPGRRRRTGAGSGGRRRRRRCAARWRTSSPTRCATARRTAASSCACEADDGRVRAWVDDGGPGLAGRRGAAGLRALLARARRARTSRARASASRSCWRRPSATAARRGSRTAAS